MAGGGSVGQMSILLHKPVHKGGGGQKCPKTVNVVYGWFPMINRISW